VPIDPASLARGVRFVWPVAGAEITQTFGPSPYDFEPPAFGFPHFHTGIDLAAPMGTPVYAAAGGIVAVAAGSSVGYGNHIIIAHDVNTMTLYGHLQAMAVQPGQTVRQGQLIGLMGSTGNSTGPHLHFEARVNNHATDPAPFLPIVAPGAKGPPAVVTG
jgi:murein DD-endopeptidase MepM/ murein hydrolase activator NlpD